MAADIVPISTQNPIDHNLRAGFDVGGTKIEFLDDHYDHVARVETANFGSMDQVLEQYFQTVNARPANIVIAMAGPRDDETGAVSLTNRKDWNRFDPNEASDRYGITIRTTNDMVASAAGILALLPDPVDANFHVLKEGQASETGTKLVVAHSTGVGAAAVVRDEMTGHQAIMPTEGGHIGIQPMNEVEDSYLTYLRSTEKKPSAEIALSGKYGFRNLLDHFLTQYVPVDLLNGPELSEFADSFERYVSEEQPLGEMIQTYLEHGSGLERAIARDVIHTMAEMFGSVVRDLAAATKATGGVYLTGSVAQNWGPFFADQTGFRRRFVAPGATHDGMMENIPIRLVLDENVAVKGAFALAKTASYA